MPSPKWYKIVDKDGKPVMRFNKRSKKEEPLLLRSGKKARDMYPPEQGFTILQIGKYEVAPDKSLKVTRGAKDEGVKYDAPSWTLGEAGRRKLRSRFTGKELPVEYEKERKMTREEFRVASAKKSEETKARWKDTRGKWKEEQPVHKGPKTKLTLKFDKNADMNRVARDIKEAWPGSEIEHVGTKTTMGGTVPVLKITIPMGEFDKGRSKFISTSSFEDVIKG